MEARASVKGIPLPDLTRDNRVHRESMEHYKCFFCKKNFGPEMAREHFGNREDLPLCIQYSRDGCGGGPHDPYVRVLKSEYDRLRSLALARSLEKTS
jgi:hypothetical protein